MVNIDLEATSSSGGRSSLTADSPNDIREILAAGLVLRLCTDGTEKPELGLLGDEPFTRCQCFRAGSKLGWRRVRKGSDSRDSVEGWEVGGR